MLTDTHRKIAAASNNRFRILEGSGPDSVGVEYQPGDGYRYVMFFHNLSEPMRRAIGCSDYDVMLTYIAAPNRHVGMTLDIHTYPVYIANKTGLGDRECQRIYEVVQFVLGDDLQERA